MLPLTFSQEACKIIKHAMAGIATCLEKERIHVNKTATTAPNELLLTNHVTQSAGSLQPHAD